VHAPRCGRPVPPVDYGLRLEVGPGDVAVPAISPAGDRPEHDRQADTRIGAEDRPGIALPRHRRILAELLVRLMAGVLWRPFDRNHDIEEFVDRIEAVEGVNDALKIQRDVFVDEYVAESREPLQPSNELW